MKQSKDLAAKAKEFRSAAVPGAINLHRDSSIDPAGAGRHDEDAIAHVNCFIDVVGDQERRGQTSLPNPQHFILHSHSGEGIESTKWFVKQENLGISNEGPRQGNALSHAARK